MSSASSAGRARSPAASVRGQFAKEQAVAQRGDRGTPAGGPGTACGTRAQGPAQHGGLAVSGFRARRWPRQRDRRGTSAATACSIRVAGGRPPRCRRRWPARRRRPSERHRSAVRADRARRPPRSSVRRGMPAAAEGGQHRDAFLGFCAACLRRVPARSPAGPAPPRHARSGSPAVGRPDAGGDDGPAQAPQISERHRSAVRADRGAHRPGPASVAAAAEGGQHRDAFLGFAAQRAFAFRAAAAASDAPRAGRRSAFPRACGPRSARRRPAPPLPSHPAWPAAQRADALRPDLRVTGHSALRH